MPPKTAVPEDPLDRNTVIDPASNLTPKGAKAKIAANLKATALLRTLDKEQRNPNAEERETLLAYSGWGAFKNAFNDGMADQAESLGFGSESDYRFDAWQANKTAFKKRFSEPRYNSAREEIASVADVYAWADKWMALHKTLKEQFSEKEYAAALRSVLNAHYTTPEIINSMWGMLRKLGFKGGRVLEPAGGTGHFIGTQPADLAERSRWDAVELDHVTARILGRLYPQARVNSVQPSPSREVEGQGFQDSRLANNSFDLVISNVPFFEKGPYQAKKQFGLDMNLHNYFFARAMEKVKPGGLVAFITSSSTMENNTKQRQALAGMGDLVAAIRLPNTAFKENAGTEVTTDIIILRKPDGRKVKGHDWIGSREVGKDSVKLKRGKDETVNTFLKSFDYSGTWENPTLQAALDIWKDMKAAQSALPQKQRKGMDQPIKGAWDNYKELFETLEEESTDKKFGAVVPIRVNEYFAANPSHAFGKHSLKGSMYRANEYTLAADPDGPSLLDAFAAVTESLPADIMGQSATAELADIRSADLTDRPFSFVIKDGDIFQVEKGDALVPVDWTAKESAVFRSWDRVRNDVRALVIAEQDPLVEADELSALRDSLNQSYDAHVFRHGAISAAGKQPPFPRPPVRPNGWLRGLPQKQITSSKRQDRSSW
ncbi:MAG: N-6 DNA methylase, partial [Verrucomicrobia bacterium]|nr:N-6 DNA methylase [Verrucomicrobiota bacterium]